MSLFSVLLQTQKAIYICVMMFIFYGKNLFGSTVKIL